MVIYTWMATIKTTGGTKRRVHSNIIKTTDPGKYPGIYSTKQFPINIVENIHTALFAEITGKELV